MYEYDGNTTDTYPVNGKTFIANTSSISRHLNANGFHYSEGSPTCHSTADLCLDYTFSAQ